MPENGFAGPFAVSGGKSGPHRSIESSTKQRKRENAADFSAAFSFGPSFAKNLEEFRKEPHGGDGGI